MPRRIIGKNNVARTVSSKLSRYRTRINHMMQMGAIHKDLFLIPARIIRFISTAEWICRNIPGGEYLTTHPSTATLGKGCPYIRSANFCSLASIKSQGFIYRYGLPIDTGTWNY